MGVGVALGIIFALIFLIWISAGFKRAKHKVLALVLIVVVLFGYFSISLVFKEKKVDFSSFDAVKESAKIYFSWFATAFTNAKSFTAHVIGWKETNTTQEK